MATIYDSQTPMLYDSEKSPDHNTLYYPYQPYSSIHLLLLTLYIYHISPNNNSPLFPDCHFT